MKRNSIESVASACKPAGVSDPAWETAWSWVGRQYAPGGFDIAAQQEFVSWISADPGNRAIYEQAAQVWLLAGLVPPANDVPLPDCDAPVH